MVIHACSPNTWEVEAEESPRSSRLSSATHWVGDQPTTTPNCKILCWCYCQNLTFINFWCVFIFGVTYLFDRVWCRPGKPGTHSVAENDLEFLFTCFHPPKAGIEGAGILEHKSNILSYIWHTVIPDVRKLTQSHQACRTHNKSGIRLEPQSLLPVRELFSLHTI